MAIDLVLSESFRSLTGEGHLSDVYCGSLSGARKHLPDRTSAAKKDSTGRDGDVGVVGRDRASYCKNILIAFNPISRSLRFVKTVIIFRTALDIK